MGKFIAQLLVFVAVFFLMWWGFSRVPWVEKFGIRQFTKEKQEQLSELMLKIHKMDKKEVHDAEILEKINDIKNRICAANYVDTSLITVHVFEDEMINAFALPGGHIVVNTELINYSDNADMLAGVMAHEIAHVELEHVSRKLTREIGIGTLIVLTGGSEHMGMLKEILHGLSSGSFDRDMEREADAQAVIYMNNMHADPRQLAFFLKKLSHNKTALPEVLEWISTHPDAKERVATILSTAGENKGTQPVLPDEEWVQLKKLVAKPENGY